MMLLDYLKKLFGKKEESLTLVGADSTESAGILQNEAATGILQNEAAAGTPQPETSASTAGSSAQDQEGAIPLVAAEKDNPDAPEAYFNPLLGIEAPADAAYQKGGSIRLTRVSASSPKRPDRLLDVSLSVAAGETVAFIGAENSGVNLLPGLLLHGLEAQEGSVEVDGINVRDYRISALRERILYLPATDEARAGADLRGVEILLLDAERCAPPDEFGTFLRNLKEQLPELTVLIFAADPAYAGDAVRTVSFSEGHVL